MSTEIIVDGEGLADVEVVIVPQGGTRREIVLAIVGKTGIAAEETLLFLEDTEEPLELDVVIDKDQNASNVHHVHRVRQVEVSVHYQGKTKMKAFSPSTRVHVVLEWAIGPKGFDIDPAIAPEMELALHGETKELPKQAHIGRYVRHPENKLVLDLIRGVIPNGSDLR